MRKQLTIVAVVISGLCLCTGQQGQGTAEPLEIRTTSPEKGFLRRSYHFQLEAEGGILPLTWEVTGGVLPFGMKLSPDGRLSGTPTETGEFRIRVTVTDSGKPAQARSQEIVLNILAPLLVEWSRYPRVSGQRIECAARVSNQTGQDFDFTIIVLAVNEAGRATAVGYQHFQLKRNTSEMEIPFAENLPLGSYEVNLDAVGEVPAEDAIYRARLVTGERLQVQQGP
jgi:Putative Ig domain